MTDRHEPTPQSWTIELPNVQPELSTSRLVLRAYEQSDAPRITELVSQPDVAATTINIPHPYPDGAASAFIIRVQEHYAGCEGIDWAVCLRGEGQLVGGMSLGFTVAHRRAELGYWIDPARWGSGLATEAARAVVRFGFETLALHKIDAHFMAHNPASGRVIENVGMQREGILRQHVFKWGKPADIIFCGILRSDYHPQSST